MSTRRSGTDGHTDTGPVVDPRRGHRRRRRLDPARRRRDERPGAPGADRRRRRHPARAHRGGQHARRRPARRAGRPPRPAARSGRRASASSTCCWSACRRPCWRRCSIAAAEPDGDLVRIMNALRQLGHGARRPRGGRGQRHRHARRRPPDVPPPADAVGRLPRRAPGGPPQRPPGAGQHDARRARRRGPGTSPGPPSGPTRTSPRRSTRRRAITAQRGAPASAARSWELASRLSPEPTDRVRRLRLAANAILDAGMASAAGRLLERADAVVLEYPDADDLIERIRRQQLRCRLPPSSGGTSEPTDQPAPGRQRGGRRGAGRRRRPALRRARRLLPRRRLRRHGEHHPRGRGAARAGRRRPGPAHRRDGRRAASSPAGRPAARRCSTGTRR